jgi:nucleoid-associated protein YgaU
MKEQQYHIDVTPEEDALFREELQATEINSKKPKFSKVFWLVLGAHVAVIAGLITTCSAMSSKPPINLEQPVAEIPETLPAELENPPIIAATEPKVPEPEIEPEPTPAPLPTPALKVTEHKQQTKTSPFVKSYTVKQGDTIYSISRKYKLNTKRLIELNNIKNPNSIKVGQTLKFM